MAHDPLFVGRESELRLLDEAARLSREGRPQAVAVEGEAGVGKSALIREWLAASEGFVRLSASCDPDDSDVPFSVIRNLVGGVPTEVLERFPLLGPGLTTAETSAVQVGRQLLALFDQLQTHGPLAVTVDDVQWADEGSWGALAAVLRRLEADSIMVVLTSRSPMAQEVHKAVSDAGGSFLRLGGLPESGVAEMLRRSTRSVADARLVSRLAEHTNGNALYLRTVLNEVAPKALHAHSEDTDTLPVPSSLAMAVQRQLADLPGPTRALMQAVAVIGTPMPLASAARLGGVLDASAALEPALEANLVRWRPEAPAAQVMITHALQRDAIIQAIDPVELRRLHAAAAAGIVDSAAAWKHRVAAAEGIDDHLAAELETAASHCLDDGAVERAATLLLWASDVAGSEYERERLLLTAMIYLLMVSKANRVRRHLPRVQACAPGPLRQTVLGCLATYAGDLDRADRELTAVATGVADATHALAACATAQAKAAVSIFRNESIETWLPVVERCLSSPGIDEFVSSGPRNFVMVAHMYREGPQGIFALDDIASLPPAWQTTPSDSLSVHIRGEAYALSGRPEPARQDLSRVLHFSEQGLSQGREEWAYPYLVLADYWSGRWDEAVAHADLGITTADERPYAATTAYVMAALVPAGRGDTNRTQELLTAARSRALPYDTIILCIGECIAAQARADYPGMLHAIERLLHAPPLMRRYYEVLWTPLHVEALIGTGQLAGAAEALGNLLTVSRTYASLKPTAAWLGGQLAEADGDKDTAGRLYGEALAAPQTSDDHVLYRAFLEEAYAKHLADGQQVEEARAWLQRARQHYAALDARAFLERCEADVTKRMDPRSGRRAEGRPGNPDELTGRERQIARLIGRGLTNKEIGGQLFLSTKTIEYHLGNIYARLSLTNRRQLRDYIKERTSEADPRP